MVHRRRGEIRRTLWVDCGWLYPVEGQYELFKAKTLVYLEGMPFSRPYTRRNGSQGMNLGLDVSHAVFMKQEDGSGRRDRSAENNS